MTQKHTMATTAEKYTTEQSIHDKLTEGDYYDRDRKMEAVIHWISTELHSRYNNLDNLNYDDDENEWTYTYGDPFGDEGKDIAKMKIYTEEEARTLAYDCLYETIKEDFNSSGLPHNWSNYFNIDGLIEDAMNTDGVIMHCGLESEYTHTDEFEFNGVYYYMGVDYHEKE